MQSWSNQILLLTSDLPYTALLSWQYLQWWNEHGCSIKLTCTHHQQRLFLPTHKLAQF